MKMLIEGIKSTEKPEIEFEYFDLEDFDGKSIDYTYRTTKDNVIDALAYLDLLSEDITDQEALDNIDDYVDQYYDELKEYFRDDAQEDAYENYEEPEPDWDSMPGGYDDLMDRKLMGDDY